MKNIQIIDDAANCTFSLFQATDEEDLRSLPRQADVLEALNRIWERPIRKQDAHGIHGTLFYELERYKKWYREKREDAVDAPAINQAQRRRLFATPADLAQLAEICRVGWTQKSSSID
ncbi:MAG TPA: hypothetical protein VFE41_26490 [Acetobacteraceae bacterium]|jgi:hypothetical protein|nr:hypothetical protein [Acetobacteraceae bacterium]